MEFCGALWSFVEEALGSCKHVVSIEGAPLASGEVELEFRGLWSYVEQCGA